MATTKRKPQPKNSPSAIRESAVRQVTREMVDALMSTPEISEAFTRADIELAIDDRGWERLSGNSGPAAMSDLDQQGREAIIKKCRLYWMRDPLAKQAVRIWTDYAIGDGITVTCKSADDQKKIDAFLKDRKNKRVTSSLGQQRGSKKLLIDGDVFFAIFSDGDNTPTIRHLDPLQITDTITDPDDDERVLAYRRQTPKKVYYYADWALDEEGKALAEEQKDPVTKKQITLEENVVCYQIPFDSIGNRGNGLLSSAVDWSREHRRFMEARVAITQALARFAFKTTVKGGQQVVNAMKAKLESSIAVSGLSGGAERNPVPASASNLVKNQGVDIEAMPRATGATDARNDSDGLKLMVSAATNVMLHYFGDPSTGNLATATAMELPMLKSFISYQDLWCDAWRDIFSIVLGEDEDLQPELVTIELPQILEDDLQKLGSFLTQLTTVFPEAKVPSVLQSCLLSLGIADIDEVMKDIAENKKVLDQQNEEMRTAEIGAMQIADPKNKAAIEALAESFKALAGKL